MALFLSTYVNKIDSKGRVSIPAQFRTALSGHNFPGIIAYPSFVHECIEACGMDRIERLSESIDSLETFSEERDAFATSILGESMQLPFDGNGRVLLPESLVKVAKLKDQAVFVGKGQTFEVWEPKAFEEYSARMREIAKKNRGILNLSGKNGKLN